MTQHDAETLPEADPPRKPHRRRWLLAPYVLLVVLIVAWSVGWYVLRLSAARELDQGAQNLREAGYDVSWTSRSIGGYPFRLETVLTDVKFAEPSGWGLAAPALRTVGAVYAPGRWVAAAPRGMTLLRPQGGPVDIRGELLRASLSDIGKRPPNIALEGRKLVFTPQPGSAPYTLNSAERLILNVRPGPDDQAAVLLSVDKAAARFSGLLGRVAQDRPVGLLWESTLDHVSSLNGDDWPAAVRAWTAAGGQLTVRKASLTAGEALLAAKSGGLTVGPDGRLRGTLEVDLREIPPAGAPMSAEQALTALAAAGGGLAQARLTFDGGQTLLGPLSVGPAPRVY